MKRLTIILLALINLYSQVPVTTDFTSSNGGRPGGNFILEILTNPLNPDKVYLATGEGFSEISNVTGAIEDMNWYNNYIGHGGASAACWSYDYKDFWMTTAVDSFISNVDDFVDVGTGVYLSEDYGQTWQKFTQPGLTPVQGLSYDACVDSTGALWLANFGQSIQKSDDKGQTFNTLVPDGYEWSPTQYMNHRLFAVHHSEVLNKIWAGTAAGVNILEDYTVEPENYQWTNYRYPQLTGNFVTAVRSQATSANTETIWCASWPVESNPEQHGISYTTDNGETWHKTLLGEKIYNFGFDGNDVYACGANGLFKSVDGGGSWEKYELMIYDPLPDKFIEIERCYSFLSYAGKYWLGTNMGLAVSDNLGNDWTLFRAYTDPEVSASTDTYAYPNPFSPKRYSELKLQFKLDTAKKVKCEIYNFAMEKVCSVTDGRQFDAGDHFITWDGKDDDGDVVANGVYFYVIEYGSEKLWNKIIVFD